MKVFEFVLFADHQAKQLEAWTCKWCKFYNCLPPEDPTECNRCKYRKCPCSFHEGKVKMQDCTITSCYSCFKDYKYSDPNYDAPGILYNLAERAVKICLRETYHSTSFEHPKDLMKELKSYKGKDLNDPTIFDACDEILWNACAHLHYKFVGNEIGHMLNMSDEIEQSLSRHEERYERKTTDLENIQEDPDTFQVKGSKKGTSYFVNLEKGLCTCPAFKFRDDCKHIHMQKKPKKKK